MTFLFRPALVLFAVLSLVTGLAYPLAVTGLAQVLFPDQANGSLVKAKGVVVGSALRPIPTTQQRPRAPTWGPAIRPWPRPWRRALQRCALPILATTALCRWTW